MGQWVLDYGLDGIDVDYEVSFLNPAIPRSSNILVF